MKKDEPSLKILYLKYYFNWWKEHPLADPEVETPVCFDEWYDNEYQIMTQTDQ